MINICIKFNIDSKSHELQHLRKAINNRIEAIQHTLCEEKSIKRDYQMK